jgi:NADH-quinone oxidoreductase subunit M
MILLYNRVIFGGLKTQYIKNFKDMSGRDFWILLIFVYFTLLLGIYPQFILTLLETPIIHILLKYS